VVSVRWPRGQRLAALQGRGADVIAQLSEVSRGFVQDRREGEPDDWALPAAELVLCDPMPQCRSAGLDDCSLGA
jgi:hypothetical protein